MNFSRRVKKNTNKNNNIKKVKKDSLNHKTNRRNNNIMKN